MAIDSQPAAAPSPAPDRAVALPDIPALTIRSGRGCLVSPDGVVETLDRPSAVRMLERAPVMVAHAGFVARRLGRSKPPRRASLHDVMELYAFVRPATPCLPTAAGLAGVLDLAAPVEAEDEAVTLTAAAYHLLSILTTVDGDEAVHLADLAQTMGRASWAWTGPVLKALGVVPPGTPLGGLDIWARLPEWQERAPQGGPASHPVSDGEAQERLEALLGPDRSVRPGQDDYVQTATAAFQPRQEKDAPTVVLAEAGTGIGKTMGYLAPASLWADQNGPSVWISTFTKNLQRQLDQEMVSVYPDGDLRRRRAVIRKGRENYLCLLNYEEAVKRGLSGVGEDPVTLALVARWLRHSRDGDMIGGDFPAWLMSTGQIQGAYGAPGLTDRRGECVYAACAHYRKCTIEKAIRRARHAHLVIANHALVLHQSAIDHGLSMVRGEDSPLTERRVRLVFDESHHLFDAADAAFGACLSAQESAELRRWVRGPESRSGRRGRGLAERISDLIADAEGEDHLAEALEAARALPRDGWAGRLGGEGGQSPSGAAERFFAAVRRHVEARADRVEGPDFSLEAGREALAEEILVTAEALGASLDHLGTPLRALSKNLRARLEDEAEDLDTPTRARIDAVTRGLDRRAALMIPSWQAMLLSLARDDGTAGMVDWFALDRLSGRVVNAAMHRRYLDPMKPFTDAVVRPLHGVLMTSASLRDTAPATDHPADDAGFPPEAPSNAEKAQGADWSFASLRTGASHLPSPSIRRQSIPSPFDYGAHARVLIVRDLAARSVEQVAGATRALFEASGGGALGLFTAISRLRAVHGRIAAGLEEKGLNVYAQHVDAMDVGTLVDIFRAETNSCLMGTDAVRDGVDVPGRSLRLIVFDRVPWPRPDILHKARRAHFGAKTYDDALTRLRLKQAFGRLIRGPEDRGVFVLLDSRMPSRLLTAFPEAVKVDRVGLAEAVAETRTFLAEDTP